MQDRKNPYIDWTVSRLLNHKEKIDIALDLKLLSEEGLDAKTFRKRHSRPECNLEQIEAWSRLNKANVEGVQVRTTYYRVRCKTHNVSSG